MQTLINALVGTTGALAFCGLIAWIESVPLPDSAMDHFVAAGEVVLNLMQAIAQ